MKIGYTTGVFDLFHIGHLNLLKKAKENCDYLIVGVTTDELVSYKHKKAVINENERIEIVKAIKYVDKVTFQDDMDKIKAHSKFKFDIMFVGDDWKNTPKWIEIESQFKKINVEVKYFPYTKGVSSTLLNEVLINLRNEKNN
jgi:glycerol-3-phosphate cytidylyltransferase